MGQYVFFFGQADTLTRYFSQWFPMPFTAPVPAACVATIIDEIKAKARSGEPATDSEPSTTTPSPKEITFQCAEQYMMYHKAILSNDLESAAAILKAPTARKQKALGRAVKGFDEELWNKYKFQIVCEGNYWKFMHKDENGDGVEMMRVLLDTGDKVLVEASPFDKIWGIGLKETDAKELPEEQWKGSNLLGKALVKARERIKLEQAGQEVPADWADL